MLHLAACSLSTFSVGKSTRRCMACLAQIAHRHRRLGALGLSYCLGVRALAQLLRQLQKMSIHILYYTC